jgi:Aldo/keto reductase family
MQYRTLGRTGIKVSPYALGALALGTSIGNPDEDDSIRIIHKALDAGINFVDTADAYGESELVVGKALKGRRDSVVLATKFSRPTGDDPNQQGASRRWIMTAVENSMRRLSSSTTCSPPPTSRSPTTSSTRSTRSSRPAPTSAPLTRRTFPRPCWIRACAVGPPVNAPPPDRSPHRMARSRCSGSCRTGPRS